MLDVIGLATVITGGDVGARMVFKMGYRVGPGEAEPASSPEGTEPQLTPSP